jgi:hypothetical protein
MKQIIQIAIRKTVKRISKDYREYKFSCSDNAIIIENGSRALTIPYSVFYDHPGFSIEERLRYRISMYTSFPNEYRSPEYLSKNDG